MQRAPDDKRPGRAVPEPADQERQDQVAIKIEAALAQSAERNEDAIDQVVSQKIRDGDLLDEPKQNQKQSLRAFFIAHDRSRLKLRQQIPGARERPGNDRREKSDEGQVIEIASRRFDRAAIDIDYVTERAKRDE